MKTKKLLTCLIFPAFLIISSSANAQFGVGASFGTQHLNVAKLNEFNRNNDLPEINQFQFLTALSFFIGTKRYFYEMNNELVSGSADNSSHVVENLSRFAFMNFGYNFSKKEKHRIFPLAGFGFGYQKLDYTEKSTGSNTFVNFMQSQAKTYSIQNENILIRLGAGWMYRLGAINPEKKTMGESIGVQVGYNLPVYQTIWKTVDLQEVRDVPKNNNQGFYAKISVQFF